MLKEMGINMDKINSQSGLIHIYTGDGKGKTTCAIGLAMRAWGRGFNILFVQFLKGSHSGELTTIEKLGERLEVRRSKEVKKFVWNMNEEELKSTKYDTKDLFDNAIKEVFKSDYDMLVLDELMGSISNKFISVEDVISFLANKPKKLEIVMTGRRAPKELIELADYVSEILPIKHPAEKGISARKGVEI